MRNWKQSKVYCNRCRRWKTPIRHANCPKGSRGSVTFLDIEHFEMGCNKCGKVWPLENNEFICSCGHIQYTKFVDSEVILEFGDEIIATDGDMVYMLRETGEIVVAQRKYFDIDWS